MRSTRIPMIEIESIIDNYERDHDFTLLYTRVRKLIENRKAVKGMNVEERRAYYAEYYQRNKERISKAAKRAYQRRQALRVTETITEARERIRKKYEKEEKK